ncbi:MAG: ABC transporter substrate-binding protein [Actinobacteria bacterium]|nr:ABC transporter substrate-binding protein [Actinomycetota bacterium]
MNAVNLRKPLILTVVASALVGSLVMNGVSASAAGDPGVSSTEIVLGMQLPQTGGASPGYNKIDDAARAYFDYVNSKGGVNGRMIKLVTKDDTYKAGVTINTAKQLINEDKIFAFFGSVGTQTHLAVVKDINRRGIPDIFVNSGYSGLYTDPKKYPNTFGGLGTYTVEAKILGKYLKEKYADKKIGILYQSDDFGRNALAGLTASGLKFEAKKTAASFVSGTHGSIGLGTQIGQLKANGVDVVIIAAVSSATAVAYATAAALAYKPTKWAVISVGADSTTFQTILGARGTAPATSAALLAGTITASHAPAAGEVDDEYIKAFKKINDDFNKSTGSGKVWDNNTLQGMNIAYLATSALMGVGKDLTRAKLVSYLEKNGAKLSSAAFAPLGYSAKTHEAFTGFWLGEYDASLLLKPLDGKRVVYTTDSGSGPVTVSNYKRPAIAADALPKVA